MGYGNITICHDLDLHVNPGEIVTLIGANGAGKSTIMGTIAGLLRPCKGVVRFEGEDITHLSAAQRVHRGLVLVPEGRHILPFMSVHENLILGAFSQRKNRKQVETDLANVLEWFPRLAELSSRDAGTLSGGEQQMLAVGRAMMARPKLVCFDEPSLGLAPQIVATIFSVIRNLSSHGATVFLVEQNAEYALGTASRGYVLQTGRIILSGPCDELKRDERVRTAYLGRLRGRPVSQEAKTSR